MRCRTIRTLSVSYTHLDVYKRQIQAYRDGMVIGNLDMTAIPHWEDGIIIIVPLLCLVTSLASTLVSTMIQKKNNPAAAQQTSQMLPSIHEALYFLSADTLLLQVF